MFFSSYFNFFSYLLGSRNAKLTYSFFFFVYVKFYLLIIYFFYNLFSFVIFIKNKNTKNIIYLTFFFKFIFNRLFFFTYFNNFLLKKKYNLRYFVNLYYFISFFFRRFIIKCFFNSYELNINLRDKKYLFNFLVFLKKDPLFYFEILNDLLAIDMLNVKNYRFLLLYNLLSLKNCSRLNITVSLKDFEKIYTVSSLYSSASWLEREVWDLSGIYFLNHTDLRRILTDYGFQGHPLRRDFPLTGFFELYYNHSFKKIIYEPVSLAQKYRNFHFENKWLQK